MGKKGIREFKTRVGFKSLCFHYFFPLLKITLLVLSKTNVSDGMQCRSFLTYLKGRILKYPGLIVVDSWLHRYSRFIKVTFVFGDQVDSKFFF